MNLLERLRHETRNAHEALHVHPLLAPLTRPEVSLNDYHYALLAFEAFYSGLEPGLPAWVESAPVRDWLARDFDAQGLTPLELGLPLPAINTPSKVWGYLYVKQGSTLGGSVMTKTLRRYLDLQPMENQHFFAGYGSETGKQWQKFIENLFASASSLQLNETVETAVACFDGIASICDAVLHLKDCDASNALQAARGTERTAT